MRELSAALAICALVGCASVSDVAPMGGGGFMVAAHGIDGHGSGADQKSIALQKASDYCSTHGGSLAVTNVVTTEAAFARPPSAEVDFRCGAK